jgi:hypothetical protein
MLDASRELRIKGVDVRWRVPLIEPLVYRLEGLFSLADDERVDAILLPASGANGDAPASDLDEDSKRFARDFLTYRLLGEDRWRLRPGRLALYEALHDTLNDVAPDGGVVRAALGEDPHPSAWDPTRREEDASEKGTAGVVAEGLRAVIEWTKARSGRRAGAAKPEHRRRGDPRWRPAADAPPLWHDPRGAHEPASGSHATPRADARPAGERGRRGVSADDGRRSAG